MTERVESPPTSADSEEVAYAAREVLMKLKKALGALRLYDSGNALVLQFEKELWDAVQSFMEEYGALKVRVRPTSFELGSERIEGAGLDELALGLFRQGLVDVGFTPELDQEQLGEFLDLLNRGLKGLDAAGDDLVTLLWSAGLTGVQHTAVLGYQEADEEDGLDFSADAVGETLDEVLGGDLDFEALSEHARGALDKKQELINNQEVELSEDLEVLASSVKYETTPMLHAHLLTVVRSALSSASADESLSEKDVRKLLETTMAMLSSTRNVDNLATFSELLRGLEANTEGDFHQVAASFVSTGISSMSLSALLGEVDEADAEGVEKLARVLATLAKADGEKLADFAEGPISERGREVIGAALSEIAAEDPSFLVARFRSADAESVSKPLALLAMVDEQKARQAFAVRLSGADLEMQTALLAAICTIKGLYDERLRMALARLAAKGGPVRRLIFDVFHELADTEVGESVWRLVEDKDFNSWEGETVESALRVLFGLGDEERVCTFIEKVLARKKFLGRRALNEVKLALVRSLTVGEKPCTGELLDRIADSRDKVLRRAAREGLRARVTGGPLMAPEKGGSL